MGKFSHIWYRSMDGKDRYGRGLLRTVIVTTALFALFMCLKKDGVFVWLGAERTIAAQHAEIRRRDEVIRRNAAHIEAIRSDRDSLEKFARETFLFAVPGDDVYILPDCR